MLNDIKVLTKLYLHSNGILPEDTSWCDFHNILTQNAPQDGIILLADAKPKDKCRYALFIDVDTKNKTSKIQYGEYESYLEIDSVDEWSSHLFWQGSGGAQSDKIRNSPHKLCSKKGDFSIDKLITPLKTILDDYCQISEGQGKAKKLKETGPLFWGETKLQERKWLKDIINILKDNKDEIDKKIKGYENKGKKIDAKFPSIKSGESVFVGLTINAKPIGKYELFRRYLLFVRTRSGIKNGTKRFKNKVVSYVMKEINGTCPSCHKEKPLLDQWTVPAELSFYQMTNESFSSYNNPTAAFRLCQGCTDLLFIFKQRLLETSTRKLGGNECLILPSIKLLPYDQKEKRRLYENLKRLWHSSTQDSASVEKGLIYRLGQLPSYATVNFIFGDYITVGKSKNVRRMDELNVVFPDVLPSRLSEIAAAIQETNKQLDKMWSLTGRNWQCSWKVQDDFYLLRQLFYPKWEEKKKVKSRRRSEVERYLRTIFYGADIAHDSLAEDCFSNLVSAIKTTQNAKKEDKNDKYVKDNYIDNTLSLLVFVEKLNKWDELLKEDTNMIGQSVFEFKAMPDLGKFVKMHPLLKDSQYLAPFFVGCLFSYAEYLQRDNSRLGAYNWLGTMTLTYEDILTDIYHKTLRYITTKEKIISSPRLQELKEAVANYDRGRCDNDRVALTAFCHGWSVGRNFIFKRDIVKAIKKKMKEMNIKITNEIKEYLDANQDQLNAKNIDVLERFLELVPEDKRAVMSTGWQKTAKQNEQEEGGGGGGGGGYDDEE